MLGIDAMLRLSFLLSLRILCEKNAARVSKKEKGESVTMLSPF